MVWPKLIERGWRVEGSTKSSKNTTRSKHSRNIWWLPPNVVRNSKEFKCRVDYFDTRPQVRFVCFPILYGARKDQAMACPQGVCMCSYPCCLCGTVRRDAFTSLMLSSDLCP